MLATPIGIYISELDGRERSFIPPRAYALDRIQSVVSIEANYYCVTWLGKMGGDRYENAACTIAKPNGHHRRIYCCGSPEHGNDFDLVSK
jgi:hypothetical protein